MGKKTTPLAMSRVEVKRQIIRYLSIQFPTEIEYAWSCNKY